MKLPWIAGLFLLLAPGLVADTLPLVTRSRVRDAADTNAWRALDRPVTWDAARTAVVVCDMWDRHHCPDATERVGEMVPRMNDVLKAARARGALIIHCPSDTMDFYRDHPGRRLAQAAPKVPTAIPLETWCHLQPDREAPLPIDDSDGGCDGCPDCPSFKAWSRQHPGLEIAAGDAITDSAEAFHLMRQRGITNVIVLGVHVNMCVLGRPFSIRQMVRQEQNVVLMRDLTDSMYNHRRRPWVSHFRGTELVVEHIEKYWCPSVTSADLLGGDPFRFAADVRKTACFLIGENEYRTWETLPEFARRELEWRGYRTTFVTSTTNALDHDFQNAAAVRDADVLVISVRRRAPPAPLLAAIRAHVAARKPLVAIRTASHAFEPHGQALPADRQWPDFDTEVLGANYENHHGAGPDTLVRAVPAAAGHPVLTGVAAEFRSPSSLYRSRALSATATPLLTGRTEDGRSGPEPVAWVHQRDGGRVFYTSLGGPEDFANPAFRRLLLNGLLWALGDFIPPADATL
jgi:nicotinamidase-related amidase